MEVGMASAVAGLALPVFKSAKYLRDRIKLVLHPLHCVCSIGLILCRCWQVASEKAELLVALSEYEKDIGHLASLYNNHKALLDQHCLSADLVELAGYICLTPLYSPVLVDLTICRILRNLNNSLPSLYPDLTKKWIPTPKELWRAGDVREVIMSGNTAIGSIRSRWQVQRGTPRSQRWTVLTVIIPDAIASLHTRVNDDNQCTTRAPGEWSSRDQSYAWSCDANDVYASARTCPAAYSFSLCAPASRTGWIQKPDDKRGSPYTIANPYSSQFPQVIANTTTSAVTFSILSPDTALACDRIKLRLGAYRALLASDSDTIELPTENNKIVLCRKQASGMEVFLDQAESLLQDIVQSRDTSMLAVLHRLRDLAKVLENLKLGEECRLTGDCALRLAVVLGERCPEFKHEQAETLALIAGLSVYQPRACTLFSKAVSICEEIVEQDPSDSCKMRLFTVLVRAGCWSKNYPDRGAQWLKRAVQLITIDLPSTMAPPYLCSVIYNAYGNYLCVLKQYADAVEVFRSAVSFQYTLISNDPEKYTSSLVCSFMTMGNSHCNLGEYHEAVAAYKAAEEHCRTASTQDPLHYNALLAQTLHQYGIALSNLHQVAEAAEVQKEAVSLFRNLAQTGTEDTKLFCSALHNYGNSCHILGHHKEAVFAYSESLQLGNALTATELDMELVDALHNMANSLHALGQYARAEVAASKALQMNQGRVLGHCGNAPDFSSCFVCQRTTFSGAMEILSLDIRAHNS
jgi:tetratricopeptide (TPR) repeat protein